MVDPTGPLIQAGKAAAKALRQAVRLSLPERALNNDYPIPRRAEDQVLYFDLMIEEALGEPTNVRGLRVEVEGGYSTTDCEYREPTRPVLVYPPFNLAPHQATRLTVIAKFESVLPEKAKVTVVADVSRHRDGRLEFQIPPPKWFPSGRVAR